MKSCFVLINLALTILFFDLSIANRATTTATKTTTKASQQKLVKNSSFQLTPNQRQNLATR